MKGKQKELTDLGKQYVFLVILGFVLVVIARLGWLNPIVGFAQNITLPLEISFNQSVKGFNNTVATVTQIGSLRSQNSDLTLENALLKAENNSLKKFEAENTSLREQLKVSLSGTLRVKLAARVIGNSGFGTKNVLLVEAGQNNGVREGDLVVVKNILLGKIIAVTPKVSSVQLLSDPDTKIPVLIPAGSEGILQGEFGSDMQLTNVLQGDVLNKGDLITTSGKDNYPKGLVVGQVESINKIDKDFFQTASIKQLIETKNLSLVYLVSVD